MINRFTSFLYNQIKIYACMSIILLFKHFFTTEVFIISLDQETRFILFSVFKDHKLL